MIPKFLDTQFEILEAYPIFQNRKRNSPKACHLVIYKFATDKLSQHILVAYRTPDSNKESDESLMEKITSSNEKYKNCIVLGDFNRDQKLRINKKFFNDHLQGLMTQKVKDITREKDKIVNGKLITTKTIIDLVFLDNDVDARFLSLDILGDSPSDHKFIKFGLDYEVPNIYTTVRYHLDPTRRVRIPSAKLPTVLDILRERITENWEILENASQSGIFEWIEVNLKELLDRFAPLNPKEEQSRKHYKIPISREFLSLKRLRMKILKKLRRLSRPKSGNAQHVIDSVRQHLRDVTNRTRSLYRKEESEYCRKSMRTGLDNSKHIWDFINKCNSRKTGKAVPDILEIKGFTKTGLANFMAGYLFDRANLVPVEEVRKYQHMIPYPQNIPDVVIDIDDNIKYDVEQLYNRGKKPSLACGPDTISHRHICDMMPELKRVLQLAIDKPIDRFHNIDTNFNRLISKERTNGIALTEKSQRPIAELNILSKYGPIQIMADQLRNQLIPFLNNNQYSFPGKGCPVAIVTVLDELNFHVSQMRPTLLVLWDFSNAFCTFLHDVAIDIAKKLNFSDRLLEIFKDFLKQTTSIIKMADGGGFYLSDKSCTERGGQQGQIFIDFVFAMLNDGIQPKSFFGEFVRRIKYVDDFQDIMSCLRIDTLFASVKKNEELIYGQSTSLGLKINESKLKMLAFHIPESEVDPAFKYFPGTDLLVKSDADLSDTDLGKLPPLLGLGFGKNPNTRSNLKVCADKAADNCLSRLRSCFPIVMTSRKVERNALNRINTATALVWRDCYDIGMIYCFVSENKFTEIQIAIRKLIKLAGLDQFTPRDVVIIHILITGKYGNQADHSAWY
jgi:hypothetical protein